MTPVDFADKLAHVSQYRCKVPWDRQPDESGKAYRAFQAYLSMPLGKRTMIGAYKELQKLDKSLRSNCPPDWSKWKKIHEWDERVAEYDSIINGERLDMLRAVRNDAYDEVAGLLLAAVKALGDLLKDPDTPHRVKMEAIFKLFDMVQLTGSGPKDADAANPKASLSGGIDLAPKVTVFMPDNNRLKNE